MIDIVMTNGLNKIGHWQESLHERLIFDVSDLLEEYPNATIVILNKRSGDENTYPVPMAQYEVEGGLLKWTLSSTDMAKQGVGRCEVVLYDESTIAKSLVYVYLVSEALESSGEPPEPWDEWIEELAGYATSASESAEAAAASAQEAQHLVDTLGLYGTLISGSNYRLELREGE